MRLPHAEFAEIGDKLEEYVLNSSHHEGRHKARNFAARLGIEIGNRSILSEAILQAALASEDVQDRGDNGFGRVFVLCFDFTTNSGTANILTAWIIRHGEEIPRLITCYVRN